MRAPPAGTGCSGASSGRRSSGSTATSPRPVSPFIKILSPQNIEFCPEDINNFPAMGTYYQNARGTIVIGKGSYIANNVTIVTANHDFSDLEAYQPGKDVIIGDRCWIGANSVILPGVHLGDHTIVGAGSIVTKSYPQGNLVIAGNPARPIRLLDARGEPAAESASPLGTSPSEADAARFSPSPHRSMKEPARPRSSGGCTRMPNRSRRRLPSHR